MDDFKLYQLPEENAAVRNATLLAAASLLVLALSHINLLDPDLFHEMALFRAALQLGHIPTQDLFAYTPTITPVVHHEWGTGAVLYGISIAAGSHGLILLRYVLALLTGIVSVCVARRRGAGWICIGLVALLGGPLLATGFGTVRAQDFTMLFVASSLLMIEVDRAGSRRWILPWLAQYVVWLNLHGGFVAGVGVLAAYAVETTIRRRRIPWRLLLVGAAMMALVLINPWGTDYPRYLLRALRMPRPQILEWAPIYRVDTAPLGCYIAVCLVAVYCLLRRGWSGSEGVLLFATIAVQASQHLRHVSLLGIVAACYVPAWLTPTPLGQTLERAATRCPRLFTAFAGMIALVSLAGMLRHTPWQLDIPVNGKDWQEHEPVVYPIGATRYLIEQQFRGTVMTPFEEGAFVSWQCYPSVKVSLDGRYEVAYPPSLLKESQSFYSGKENWRMTLTRYPTDLVLVPTPWRLAALMSGESGWDRIYQDDAYQLYARPGLNIPHMDRRGEKLTASFPY
jgi:hypothetical protein